MSAQRKQKMGLYTNIAVLPDRPMSRPLTSNSLDSTTIGGRTFTTATFDTYKDSAAYYDWPDLPPIEKIKDAIVRSRVSKGISYLLPVEKSKNSIETNFQTDLRAMFTEPYTTERPNYDEARTVASAKHHLAPNTAMSADRRAISRILSPQFERDVQLNADSEKVRRSYSHSAPARARTKVHDHKNLQKRSNLFIPLKAKVPPELLKLKEEAEKILQSVQEKDDDDEESKNEAKETPKPDRNARKSTTAFSFFSDPFSQDMSFMTFEGGHGGYGDRSLASGQHQFVRSTEKAGIKVFKDFEKIKGPVKPPFPEELRSPYLNDAKNDQIWDWLVEGEKIDEFDYFLSVCG